MIFLPARKDVEPWRKLEPEIASAKKAIEARKVEAGPLFTNWMDAAKDWLRHQAYNPVISLSAFTAAAIARSASALTRFE